MMDKEDGMRKMIEKENLPSWLIYNEGRFYAENPYFMLITSCIVFSNLSAV
jgi:hypothetical protein